MIGRTPDKLPTIYLYFAVLVTNTIGLLLVVNVALGVIYYFRDATPQQENPPAATSTLPKDALFNKDGSPIDNGKRTAYQLEWVDFKAYENLDARYVSDVLDSFWTLLNGGFMYEPWVGYAEPPFTTKLVNVDTDAEGFPLRRTINRKADERLPTIRIFTMGGSPTFGYNVSDEHTWPSRLAKILSDKAEADRLRVNVQVLNYGKASYYPTQETMLLIDHLKTSPSPDLVIFMDGVNWGSCDYLQDVPMFAHEMTVEMQNMQFHPPITEGLTWIPIVRLANSLRNRLFSADKKRVDSPRKLDEARCEDNMVNVFERDQEVSLAVASFYQAETLFVLEPNAFYNYPEHLFRRPLTDSFVAERKRTKNLYQRLLSKPGVVGRTVDLSGLFEEWGDRKAVVDDIHYSPAFAEFLAEHVASHIDLRALALQALKDRDAASGGSLQNAVSDQN